MEVRNLIEPNATVVQITKVSVGDVYKRLHEAQYTQPRIVFGVITDVLNNGKDCSLVALEFGPSAYSQDIQAQSQVFTNKTELALFPATVEEYKAALADAIEVQTKIVERAELDWQVKSNILNQMCQRQNTALSAAVTQEITQ